MELDVFAPTTEDDPVAGEAHTDALAMAGMWYNRVAASVPDGSEIRDRWGNIYKGRTKLFSNGGEPEAVQQMVTAVLSESSASKPPVKKIAKAAPWAKASAPVPGEKGSSSKDRWAVGAAEDAWSAAAPVGAPRSPRPPLGRGQHR